MRRERSRRTAARPCPPSSKPSRKRTSASADDAPSYAGKSAEWWVGELANAKTEQAARGALTAMGAPALPALVAGLADAHAPKVQAGVAAFIRGFPGDPEPLIDVLASTL